MRHSIFFYKELTPAEVGKTGTHEVYVRLPNNFDYESFFGNSANMNGSVMEVNFIAQDITDGGSDSVSLRFAFFKNSNQEKRIPSLGPLFKSHNVQEGDVVCLESRIDGTSTTYSICFYKKGEIQVSPAAIYFSRVERDVLETPKNNYNYQSLQQIFYGAPGTGKSNTIKCEVDQKDLPRVRTIFHPDSDYSTFVGAYKPTSVEVPVMTIIGKEQMPVVNAKPEKKIVYEFVPQAFLKAYTGAWKNQDKPFYLIIEEINRGNCAQIFGDLFQLLDRNDETGLSDYPISPDEDIQKFLLTDKKYGFAALTEEQKAAIPEEVLFGELMILPKNLHIWATMNTSDQSLFPIDSAFKRRWDWQYMPISDEKKGWQIEANGKRYDWWQFLQKMNDKIGSTTNSEDKKLGYFFCKAKNGIIDAETFVGKVVFYIWNDVFKDFAEESGDLFKDTSDTNNPLLSFNKFYAVGNDGKAKVVADKVTIFLQNLGIELISDANTEEVIEDEDGNETSSTSRDYSKFSINGKGRYAKNNLAAECVKKYIELNPNMSLDDVLANWRGLGNIVPHFVESKEEYEARTDNSKRSHEIPYDGSVIYVAHNGYGNNGKVFTLIEAVNKKNWGLTLAKVEE